MALLVLTLAGWLPAQTDVLEAKSHEATDLMAAGRFEDAIPLYRDLVRALPNNPGLITDLGLALDMAGRKREAVREFQAALKLDSRQVTALLFLGTAYLELGQPANAIEPLESVLMIQPDNHDAQEVLAEAFLAQGDDEDAALRFEKLSKIDTQNPKVWYGLGLSYEALAQHNFEMLQNAAPDSAYWLALVAESRLKLRQYNSAFFFYRQALNKMPLSGIHEAIAEIYRSTGHADWASVEQEREKEAAAVDCHRDTLECDFTAGRYSELVTAASRLNTPESYYWRTRTYNKLALEAFSRLGQLPPSAEVHELMAKIHFDQRQYDESAREWQEALKLSPGNTYVRRQLALSLLKKNDREAARRLLESLLQESPESPELNYLMGDTLLNLQRVDEAVPFLRKAVMLGPRLLAARGDLGRAYLQLGRAREAVPQLKAALPIDDDGNLHYLLARAYQTSGQQQLAQQTLKAYQDMRKSVTAENQNLEQNVQITPP